jgi:hypothetical protein
MMRTRLSQERGAVLVHVAFILLGCVAITGLVVDFGMMWVSRRQAQNAADAGALSGAVARILNDSSPSPSTTSGKVYDSIVHTVADNPIWGQSPPPGTVDIGWDCPDGTSNCARVDVFRDGTHTSTPVPTVFMVLANVTSQQVRAHAIAQIIAANGTGCMRPWFLIDKYTGPVSPFTSPPDTYTSPGYQVPADIGTIVDFHPNTSPSGYGQVDTGPGGKAVKEAIEHCVSDQTYYIGETVRVKPGGTQGPESQGTAAIIAADPNAYVSISTGADGTKTATVEDSCAPGGCGDCGFGGCPYGGQISPRVVVVPICSPFEAGCRDGGQSNSTITITNFLSFFVLDYVKCGGPGNNDWCIKGELIGTAGAQVANGGPVPTGGDFLKTIVLVR